MTTALGAKSWRRCPSCDQEGPHTFLEAKPASDNMQAQIHQCDECLLEIAQFVRNGSLSAVPLDELTVTAPTAALYQEAESIPIATHTRD